MAQLRASINQAENEKKRKCDFQKLQADIASIIELDNQEAVNIESQIKIQEELEDQNTARYITTEQDWEEKLKEWYELLDEEEKVQFTDELMDNNEPNNNLLSSYIYPAINESAKWNLRNLFIRELKKPDFIFTSSEFN